MRSLRIGDLVYWKPMDYFASVGVILADKDDDGYPVIYWLYEDPDGFSSGETRWHSFEQIKLLKDKKK